MSGYNLTPEQQGEMFKGLLEVRDSAEVNMMDRLSVAGVLARRGYRQYAEVLRASRGGYGSLLMEFSEWLGAREVNRTAPGYDVSEPGHPDNPRTW